MTSEELVEEIYKKLPLYQNDLLKHEELIDLSFFVDHLNELLKEEIK